jgi:hypothetical protein
MKKIIAVCFGVCVAVSCLAQPEVVPVLTCTGVTTSTTPVTATSEVTYAGYVKGLQVAVTPANTTCTVTVATSGAGGLSAQTLYTTAAAANTVMLYPSVEVSTNGTGAADFACPVICNDKLTVSAHTATVDTSITVRVTAVIDRK